MKVSAMILLLTILVVLALTGCSVEPGTSADTTATIEVSTTAEAPSATTTTAQASTTTTVPVTTTVKSGYEWAYGEAVDFDGMVIAVDAPIKDEAARMTDEGMVAWLALVTITNERAQPIDYSPITFRMADAEGFTYDYALVLPSKPELDSASLAPGQMVKGYVPFELPSSATPAQVVFEAYDEAGQKWLALWE